MQNKKEYNDKVKELLDTGVNYPTALAKALDIDKNVFNPNDLLGISYLKAINKNKYPIEAHTIKRTSDYHDLRENKEIISASNIRNRIKNKEDISLYVPRKVVKLIEELDLNMLFPFLKYKILMDNQLAKYLTVDEGIENRLKDKIMEAENIEEFIKLVKTKRYTYNKICRMFIHILLSVPKDINKIANIEYIKILGFNKKGRAYLKSLKDIDVGLVPIPNSIVYKYEIKAAQLYSLISKNKIMKYEKSNKPIFLE